MGEIYKVKVKAKFECFSHLEDFKIAAAEIVGNRYDTTNREEPTLV